MKCIQLIFRKIGNHWYLDIEHDNPRDLILNPVLERFINKLDRWDQHVVDNIYLIEETGFISSDGLLQFSDEDMLRYFTTNDHFDMTIYISGHKFKISSTLYSLLENKYQLDFHVSLYKFIIY